MTTTVKHKSLYLQDGDGDYVFDPNNPEDKVFDENKIEISVSQALRVDPSLGGKAVFVNESGVPLMALRDQGDLQLGFLAAPKLPSAAVNGPKKSLFSNRGILGSLGALAVLGGVVYCFTEKTEMGPVLEGARAEVLDDQQFESFIIYNRISKDVYKRKPTEELMRLAEDGDELALQVLEERAFESFEVFKFLRELKAKRNRGVYLQKTDAELFLLLEGGDHRALLRLLEELARARSKRRIEALKGPLQAYFDSRQVPLEFVLNTLLLIDAGEGKYYAWKPLHGELLRNQSYDFEDVLSRWLEEGEECFSQVCRTELRREGVLAH